MEEARRRADEHEAAEHFRSEPEKPIRLGQLLKRIGSADLIRIKAGGEVIFSGMRMQAPHIYDDELVGRFGPVLDIFRADWEEAGLKQPLDAAELPKYELKNLNIRLYMVLELDV